MLRRLLHTFPGTCAGIVSGFSRQQHFKLSLARGAHIRRLGGVGCCDRKLLELLEILPVLD